MRRVRCPRCKRIYAVGYNGVAAGCDACLGIQRDKNGYAWLPDETEQTYVSMADGSVFTVRREDAGLRCEPGAEG